MDDAEATALFPEALTIDQVFPHAGEFFAKRENFRATLNMLKDVLAAGGFPTKYQYEQGLLDAISGTAKTLLSSTWISALSKHVDTYVVVHGCERTKYGCPDATHKVYLLKEEDDVYRFVRRVSLSQRCLLLTSPRSDDRG